MEGEERWVPLKERSCAFGKLVALSKPQGHVNNPHGRCWTDYVHFKVCKSVKPRILSPQQFMWQKDLLLDVISFGNVQFRKGSGWFNNILFWNLFTITSVLWGCFWNENLSKVMKHFNEIACVKMFCSCLVFIVVHTQVLHCRLLPVWMPDLTTGFSGCSRRLSRKMLLHITAQMFH